MTIAMITDCLGILILLTGVLIFFIGASSSLFSHSGKFIPAEKVFILSPANLPPTKNNFKNIRGFDLQQLNSVFFISNKNYQSELQVCSTAKLPGVVSLKKVNITL